MVLIPDKFLILNSLALKLAYYIDCVLLLPSSLSLARHQARYQTTPNKPLTSLFVPGMAMVFDEAPEHQPDLPKKFPTCEQSYDLSEEEWRLYDGAPYGKVPKMPDDNKEKPEEEDKEEENGGNNMRPLDDDGKLLKYGTEPSCKYLTILIMYSY